MAQLKLKQLDSILTGSLQVSGSAGVTGSFGITAGEKLFTGADENEYIQTDTADRMRFVVGGSQMLLLDQDDSRVNVGYGMKLGVGLGNNTTPGEVLEVVGNISGSGTGSFSRLEISGNANIDGDITLGGNIQLGDSDTDSVTITSDLTSNLTPNADSTYDIGSSTKYWRNAYIDSVTTTGNVSGSSTSTGSFGQIDSSGRIFEQGSSVIDHATAMAIVFGG